jgi:hypothetical protein
MITRPQAEGGRTTLLQRLSVTLKDKLVESAARLK